MCGKNWAGVGGVGRVEPVFRVLPKYRLSKREGGGEGTTIGEKDEISLKSWHIEMV